jgi:hypothetical protein
MFTYVTIKSDLESVLIHSSGLFNFATILPRLEIIYTFCSSFEISNMLGCGSGCMDIGVDNMYIRILIENGIIGFIVFMFFIYTIIKQLFYITIQPRTLPFSTAKLKKSTKKENIFCFFIFIIMSFSMHSGELLDSRFSIIVYIYIILYINNKYIKLKNYEKLCINNKDVFN